MPGSPASIFPLGFSTELLCAYFIVTALPFFSPQNVSIGIVGKNTLFKVLDEEGTAQYLRMIEGEEKRGGQPDTTGQDPTPPQPPPSGEGPQDPVPAVAMETE